MYKDNTSDKEYKLFHYFCTYVGTKGEKAIQTESIIYCSPTHGRVNEGFEAKTNLLKSRICSRMQSIQIYCKA